MKTLLLMRHAKSDWSNQKLNDFDRPLNGRGYKDAFNAGKFLQKYHLIPDLIITSSAKRTVLTSIIIAKRIKYKKKNIILDDLLYESTTSYYLKLIRSIDEKVNFALLVGHNPELQNTLEMFLSCLNTKNNIFLLKSSNLPTASMSFLHINSKTWKKVIFGNNQLLNYLSPKNIVDYI